MSRLTLLITKNISLQDILNVQEHEDQEPIKPYAIKQVQNGQNAFVKWSDLKLKPELMVGIQDVGFQYPTEIQYKVIPQIIADQDRDVLCQAKPGAGKTAVYILAILNMLTPQSDGQYLSHHCIVAVSTRQLAHQIFIEFRKLSIGFTKPQLRVASYFGGLSLWDSKYQLKTKYLTPHIIIGTLGRMRHLISQNHIRTDHVKYFVIDQCDRIVDNNQNLEDLKYLLRNTAKTKQMLLFTATLTEKTRKNCVAIMKKTKAPFILELQNKKVNPRYLTHYYVRLSEKQKLTKLIRILDGINFNQAIIFLNVIQKAMIITDQLRMQLFNPICIHSKLPQSERIKIYDLFKESGSKIMVATDVFGRGVDIQQVNLVINYDFPKQQTMYMHRAARGGRFGKKGIVINFVRDEASEDEKVSKDQNIFTNIINQYEVKFSQLPENLDQTKFY